MTKELSDQYFQGIMDAVPDPIVVYNTVGEVKYLNRQFAATFGWTLDELIGKRLDFVPPSEVEKTRDAVMRTINGEVVLFETQRYHKNGDTIDIQVSASIFDKQSGEKGGMIVAFRNISELKSAEEKLIKAREEAVLANRSKSDFLAKMSHEIRTPMNAIIGLTDLALKTQMTEKQYDYLEKVSWSAHALLEIINDILDFSKIEAGKMTLESLDFNLEDVLSHLADLVAIKAAEKGIEINFQLENDVPLGLKGDSLRLGQVLLNLMNNAVKFTEKGEIVIATSLKEKTDDQIKLKFMVQDTGIGLSPEQADHLFESFNQADESTTRKFGGTGLGLTICKKLVQMMGGDIWMKSRPGIGSRFYFTASFGRQSSQTVITFPRLDELRGLNVLVIDDSKIARQIFKDHMTAMSFNVTLASSGQAGIKKIIKADSSTPFDLILVDWIMPGMDGLETAKTIINNKTLKHRPKIIMITAFGREDMKFQVEKYKLDGFLLKPVNPSILLDTVATAYGKEIKSQNHPILSSFKDKDLLDSIRGAQILLVEDNMINQQVAFELMDREGISVTIANNGAEAVDFVRKQSFNLVLMDIQMPIMDGYTATKKIKNMPAGKKLPIVAMTAHALTDDHKKSLDCGMKDHITKPINPEEFFSILLKWIDPQEIVGDIPVKKPKSKVNDNKYGPLPESLPGFDIQDGLSRASNDEALYLELLNLFKEDSKSLVNQIKTTFKDGDFENTCSLVHNIKGVSGNLGATKLFQKANNLELALKADEKSLYQELYEIFEKELDTVMASLEKINSEKQHKQTLTQEVSDEVNAQKLLAILREYKSFVKANKPKKCKNLLNEINNIEFSQDLAKKIDLLGNQLSRYNFKDGFKTLVEIEQKLQ